MNDPEYQYIKGLGWQPFATRRQTTVTLKDGAKYLLIDKVPEIGDLCIWGWSGSSTYSVNHTNVPNLDAFADFMKNYGPYELVTFDDKNLEYVTNSALSAGELPCWVTIVKL
jgi:hypothetical protein